MQHMQTTFNVNNSSSAEIQAATNEVLKTVAYTLLRQVHGVREPARINVQSGVDFYGEVQNFEVSLIKQALFFTNGKLSAAASLLNLNATTLYSKIKFYGIERPNVKDLSGSSFQRLSQKRRAG